MTRTSTATAETATTAETTTTRVPTDRVVHVDPNTLVIEDNIRTDVRLPRDLVESIRLHGVIVPILAHPGPDNIIVVRDGQLRTLAARQVSRTTVPVCIVNADDETTTRIIEQYITGVHRLALGKADQASAWRQLALAGMSVTAISRQTGAKREQVKTGITVAEHDVAAAAVAEYDLTFDQASVLIELEDDPKAVAELRRVAKKNPASFDHAAQRALDAKAAREQLARTRAEYEAKGHAIVDWPDHGDSDTLFFRDLQTADGDPLTEANYAGQPGHAVAISERWGSVQVGHVVVDWRKHGLRRISSTGTVNGGKLTEKEKADRRRVVANNKAWDSAEKVRRTWLAKLLTRKRLPTDALPFAAITLATNTFEVARAVASDHALAEELLGQEHRHGKHPLADQVIKTPTQAGHVVVAIALAAMEAAIDRYTWRNPTPAATRYLTQLAAWGYTLSDVERLVADSATKRQPTRTKPATSAAS